MFDVYHILHISLLGALSWAILKFLKGVCLKHPLDNIPGPPPESYLWGPLNSGPRDDY